MLRGEILGIPNAVANTGLGHDQVGQIPLRIGSRDSPANASDVHVQVVALVRILEAPDRAQQAPAAHDTPGIGDERLEQLVFPGREVELLASDRDPATSRVELQRADADLATGSIVEDLSLGIAMTRKGRPPRLVEAAGVRSAPADMADALAQRTRWEHGFLQTLRRQALPVLLGGLRRGSRAEILLGLHLMVPPLALLLMLAAVALALQAGLVLLGGSLVALLALASLTAAALVMVAVAWMVGGRPFLSAAALLRAPLYVLWKLPVYAGFLKKPEARWTRTPRRPKP